MFETIGNLFAICLWAAAIFGFLGGVIACIINIVRGNGWARFVSIMAAIIGTFVFFRMYAWCGSILWCLLVTGIVLAFVRVPEPGEAKSTPQSGSGYGIGQAFLDAYVEENVIEEAVTNALRKSKE